MNSKKNIIDTLRGADKASVEKLMAEEAKKNEIFAKAMERVSEVNENGFSISSKTTITAAIPKAPRILQKLQKKKYHTK